jgi:hypothetical protein
MSATVKAAKPAKPKLSREQLRMLSEIERQEYYTSRLPEDFKFPLFNGRQAVLSQRQSGYRTTARAAREIIDNAIEAGAKTMRIIFDQPSEANREKHERKNSVRAIAFIDDGPGMTPEMARYALTWGGGTHFDDPNYIGKFGFGLPNSSVNQTTRVEVYTRAGEDKPWHMVELDINKLDEFGEVNIPGGKDTELPGFVADYLERSRIELGSGTVVVWVRPDRLTYNQATTLKEHMLDDFGVTYRYSLPRYEVDAESNRQKLVSAGRVKLYVQDKAVEPIDPLFLTPGARFYLPSNSAEPEKGGAWETFGRDGSDGRLIAVKYYIDEETGAKRLAWLQSDEELEKARQDKEVRAVGHIHVRISRMPVGFVDGTIGAKKAKTVPYRRFEIRQARRGMSFVRADREIETLDAFRRSAHDRESGLGEWPHISTYAYHFGVEVRFDPDLDEAFGVGNDKQTICPIDDFWRVMASDEVELDKAVRAEEKYQQEQRDRKRRKQNEPAATDPERSTPAAAAAEAASAALGRPKKVPDYRAEEARELLEKAIQERVELTGESVEKARKAIEEEAKRKRFKIDFFEADGGVFYRPTLGNGMQRVVMLNKLHPFFTVFYSRLAQVPDPIALQTTQLLLMMLADAELVAEEELSVMYQTQRESAWSPFLKVGLKKLEELEPQREEESVNGE